MSSNGKTHRRSLKECLRAILQRRRVDNDDITEGSGILKRTDPSLALLPTFGSLSTLPDFGSSRYDIDQFSISVNGEPNNALTRMSTANCSQHTIIAPRAISSLSQHEIHDAYHFQSELSQLARFCSDDLYSNYSSVSVNHTKLASICTQESLLPKTSLNQLMTSDNVYFQSPLTQIAHACNVPSLYRQGTSLQASLVTLDPFMRSSSTLRLQRSTQSLASDLRSSPSLYPPHTVTFDSHVDAGSSYESERIFLSQKRSSRSSLKEEARMKPRLNHRHQRAVELETGLSSINHFSSFCVLDAAQPGCPLTAVSEDLRYVFEIGEDFCLNTAGVDGADMDTITGQDAEGNTIVHIVVYSPLINPSSGRSRFMLASLLDITSFITETALVPDLETISEESVFEEELKTPPRFPTQQSPRYELSSENLLGGCFLPEANLHTPVQHSKDDIWLDIASEESRKSRSIKSNPSTSRSHSASSGHSMDNALDQFLATLQVLYSDFFLLGKSPLDEYSYEICNVSPKVYSSREYIEGHLTRTSFEDRILLEQKLTQERAFHMQIRWGSLGEPKQLYCIPLFGRSNVTWVCFLVDEDKWSGLPVWD